MRTIREVRVHKDTPFVADIYAEFLSGYVDEDTGDIIIHVLDQMDNSRKWEVKTFRIGDEVPAGARYVGTSFEEYYQDLVHIFAVIAN